MERPSYYAIIPASVRYDKDLKPMERLLYGEITALCGASGYCWGTNAYFADLYGVSTRTICEWVNHLKAKGYIKIEIIYREGTKEVQERRLYIAPAVNDNEEPHEENFHTSRNNFRDMSRNNFRDPHEENFQENNININNTSMNNIIGDAPEKKRKKFVKPSIDEIIEYCRERQNHVDPQKFYDHYESNGWMVGKNAMKDWKAAVRTWERNGYSGSNTNAPRVYADNKPEGFDYFDF